MPGRGACDRWPMLVGSASERGLVGEAEITPSLSHVRVSHAWGHVIPEHPIYTSAPEAQRPACPPAPTPALRCAATVGARQNGAQRAVPAELAAPTTNGL